MANRTPAQLLKLTELGPQEAGRILWPQYRIRTNIRLVSLPPRNSPRLKGAIHRGLLWLLTGCPRPEPTQRLRLGVVQELEGKLTLVQIYQPHSDSKLFIRLPTYRNSSQVSSSVVHVPSPVAPVTAGPRARPSRLSAAWSHTKVFVTSMNCCRRRRQH